MQVQRVLLPASRRESWTVLGEDDTPLAPIERYLAYLSDIEKSPNTVKAYAHDLKDWFVFQAVPAPHQQVLAGSRPGDQAQGPPQASAGADRRGGTADP